MSINMADVKQIMHNNKEVAKIEDGLGNILWQKQGPAPTYKYYYIDNNNVIAIDFANKTKTAYTRSGGSSATMTNGSVGYYNGHLYCAAQGTKTWEITLDDVNHTYKFTLISGFPTYMNWAYRMPNGNCYYTTTAGVPSDTRKLGTSISASVGINIAGGTTFTDGTNYYGCSEQGTDATIYKLVNNEWVTQSDITHPGIEGYNIWYLDGHLYADSGTTHREWDFTNKVWVQKLWFGNSNFNGGRVFADKDGNVYQVGNTSTNRYIWKLDKATSTWSQYWDWGTAIRGDNMCCQYGGLQLAQIMRPGKEM